MPAPNTPAMTLEALSVWLRDAECASLQSRREMQSAIRILAKITGRSAADIIADPAVIREAFKCAPWQLANLTKARWANIRSLVTRAMQLAGINVHRQRRNYKLTQPWEDCLAPLERRDRDELRRFAGWCSVRCINPEDVADDTFVRFLTDLEALSTQRNPRERAHVARRAWNRAIAVDGSPYPQIAPPMPIGVRAMHFTDFPKSLRDDVALYCLWAVTSSQLDDESGRRPIRPITLDGYLTRLRILMTALVEAGVRADHFISLTRLIDPAMVKRGMNHWLGGSDLDDRARQNLHGMAVATLSVARYLGKSDDEISQLRKLAKKVRFVAVGMCEKNKKRLRPLMHPDVCKRLLKLPTQIQSELAATKSPTVRQAQRLQQALVLEILLHLPLRVRNLSELDLSTNISKPVAGLNGRWRISIPGDEVKNRVAIDAELGEWTSALIDLYLDKFRPVLAKGKTSRLFITQYGDAIGSSALSKQLARFVKREAGLELHTHLLRHFAAHLYLSASPGNYEYVRKLLGHRNIDTTIRFYASLASEQAVNVYDAMIDAIRNEADGDLEGSDHILPVHLIEEENDQ